MLKLVQTDWGRFDLEMDDPADDDADTAVATLVYAALFTDAEAPTSRVDDPFDRRGWYANPQAGSGLWHVRRQPLNSNARREALNSVRTALMTHAPTLTNVEVKEVALTDTSGSVSSVLLEVTGSHNGRNFTVKAPL